MFKRVQCALTVVCIYSSTVLGGAETTTATRASLSIGIGRTDRFGRDVNPDYQQHIHDVLTATRLNRISSISHDLENATPNLEAEHRINTSAIKGANYIPSYAPNSISTWIDYDERVIARELSYAKVFSASMSYARSLSCHAYFIGSSSMSKCNWIVDFFSGSGIPCNQSQPDNSVPYVACV